MTEKPQGMYVLQTYKDKLVLVEGPDENLGKSERVVSIAGTEHLKQGTATVFLDSQLAFTLGHVATDGLTEMTALNPAEHDEFLSGGIEAGDSWDDTVRFEAAQELGIAVTLSQAIRYPVDLNMPIVVQQMRNGKDVVFKLEGGLLVLNDDQMQHIRDKKRHVAFDLVGMARYLADNPKYIRPASQAMLLAVLANQEVAAYVHDALQNATV